MGLFDFLKSKKSSDQDQSAPVDKNLQRLARTAGDKRAQTYDRMEAIQELAGMATPDAAAALLKRFTFYIDPSISDQEEKDVAFRGIVAAGEGALQPIRDFAARAESLTWPLKILQEILTEEAYVDELLVILGRFDTEYTKNAEPKAQLIAALEGIKHPDLLQAALPFLEDFDEPVRFHTIATIFSQEAPDSVEGICRALIAEESVRVKNRIGEGLASRGWPIPEALRTEVARTLPSAYRLDGSTIKRN